MSTTSTKTRKGTTWAALDADRSAQRGQAKAAATAATLKAERDRRLVNALLGR